MLPAPWLQSVNYRLPLFPQPAAGPPRGPEMELMLITVPGPPWSAQLSDGSRAACWETQRRKAARARDDWWMRPSSLYLCIQAALCCSHSQWQEVEQKETDDFHLRGPQPQESPGAAPVRPCRCLIQESWAVLLLLFLLGLGGFHVEFRQCVMRIWVLREHCLWADVIMWWWARGREPKHTWLMGIQVHYGICFTFSGLCFSRRTCLFKSSHFSHCLSDSASLGPSSPRHLRRRKKRLFFLIKLSMTSP